MLTGIPMFSIWKAFGCVVSPAPHTHRECVCVCSWVWLVSFLLFASSCSLPNWLWKARSVGWWDLRCCGLETLQAKKLQAVLSRTLQTSGQNVYCHTDALSAALNFDWKKKPDFPDFSLLCHIRLCWELLSWEASEWGIGGWSRGKRKENSLGKVSMLLWFP